MRADAELFAERFTCYLIDPHGSGGSTPPQDEIAYDPEGERLPTDLVYNRGCRVW
jgi:pimeloyl-ACP methyl ester carboxylesterase